MRYYFVFLFLVSSVVFSQNSLHVDSIPLSLKEQTDAVVRLDKIDFKIKDKSKAFLRTHYVVTVFNDQGANGQLEYEVFYSKYEKILDISGNVYDKNGDRIYKLAKKDIYDISASAYSNDVTDSRIKIAEFDNKNFQYPYTIEFETSIETTNMMFYPSQYFSPSKRLSTQEKTLMIEAPKDFEFRYKEKNMPNTVTLNVEKNKKTYTWTIKNILSNEFEIFTPIDFYPEIVTAPKDFSVGDYHSTIESWNDIGKFISMLNKDRDILPADVKHKIVDLVGQERDTLKKIEILYHYLQNNTRYVSVQLGIGGWQTKSAKEVAQTGYGDCKALSNYMKALLKTVGINSHIALIVAGEEEENIDPNFPSMRFNHEINCVPLKNDTIWLECTSQINAFGFLGSFTGNRKALIILDNGAKLVNTIKYNSSDNSKITKAKILIDIATNAHAEVETIYAGIVKSNKDYLLEEKNEEKLKKMLQNMIHIPSFVIDKFSMKEYKSKIPSLQVKLALEVNKIGNKTGSFFFLKPSFFNNQAFSTADKKTRNTDFYLNPNIYNIEEIDSLTYQMPENMLPQILPDAVFIKNQFGEYSSVIKYKDGILFYYRKLIQYSGYFLKSDYAAYHEFRNTVNKNDNQQIAFKILN